MPCFGIKPMPHQCYDAVALTALIYLKILRRDLAIGADHIYKQPPLDKVATPDAQTVI